MRQWMLVIKKSVNQFSVFDFGMLKLCLISIGIIIGLYLYHALADYIWFFWLLFLISWLYIVMRIFTVKVK